MVRDDDLQRLLRGLARTPPPDVALDAIFGRWQRRRRGKMVVGGIALAGALSACLLLFVPPRTEPPPVYLKLKLVQVFDEAEPPDDESPEARGP